MNPFDQADIAAAEAQLYTFGEQVRYRPRSGTPRAVLAIITYDAPAIIDGSGNVTTPKAIIQVANRQTAVADDGVGGIGVKEYNPGGGDTITLPDAPGSSTTETLGVYRPPPGTFSSDAGMHTLILR
jgi:hypothetical protein